MVDRLIQTKFIPEYPEMPRSQLEIVTPLDKISGDLVKRCIIQLRENPSLQEELGVSRFGGEVSDYIENRLETVDELGGDGYRIGVHTGLYILEQFYGENAPIITPGSKIRSQTFIAQRKDLALLDEYRTYYTALTEQIPGLQGLFRTDLIVGDIEIKHALRQAMAGVVDVFVLVNFAQRAAPQNQ